MRPTSLKAHLIAQLALLSAATSSSSNGGPKPKLKIQPYVADPLAQERAEHNAKIEAKRKAKKKR